MSNKGKYTIEVLDVTLDVIEYLAASGQEPQRHAEIARQLGIHRNRAFRILKTLEERGYVEANSETRGYQLGLKFLEVGELVHERLDVGRVADRILMELAKKTGDVAQLLVLYRHSAVCIDSYRGDHRLQVAAPIGQPLPLHIGASPKILLAHLPEQDRERILQSIELTRFTPNTITDRDELRHCLDEIRAQGYAVDEEDFEVGVYAVGAPVRDHCGRVVASITVTTPESRYSPQRRQELIEMVTNAASRVSARLG
jgi:IclR family KDG regulon transcriptional repressor